MNNQFASQLADLRRVASRTNGDDRRDGGRGDRTGHSNDTNANDTNNTNVNNNSRDFHSRDGGYRRHGDESDRKRRREDDHHRHDRRTGRGGQYYRGGNSYRQPYDRRREEDYRQRPQQQQQHLKSREPYIPLADAVSGIAKRYDESVNVADNGSGNNSNKRRHVALLFLTIDDLPHEHIWREWVKGGNDINSNISSGSIGTNNNTGDEEEAMNHESDDGMTVSILCHAKHPERITSPWLRQRHLIKFRRKNNDTADNPNEPPKLHSRRPEWGSIEITRGMIDLLEEGLRIGVREEGESVQTEGGGGLENSDSTVAAATTASATTTAMNDIYSSYKRYLSTPNDALTEESFDASCIPSDRDIPPVDRFIFVSESCLPVTTLKEMEMALFGPRSDTTKQTKEDDDERSNKLYPYDKSWINARSTPNNGYSRQLQWNEIRSSDIPPRLIWKADQWIVLNRTHGEAAASLPREYLNGRTLWYAFRRCRASDEMYFPTALAILGVIARPAGVTEVDDANDGNEQCAGDRIRRRKVTYCDWSVSAKNPASFTAKELEDVTMKARGEGCLLARKFVPLSRSGQGAGGDTGIVSVEDWRALMQKLTIK